MAKQEDFDADIEEKSAEQRATARNIAHMLGNASSASDSLGRREKKEKQLHLMLTETRFQRLKEISKITGFSSNEVVGRLIDKFYEKEIQK